MFSGILNLEKLRNVPKSKPRILTVSELQTRLCCHKNECVITVHRWEMFLLLELSENLKILNAFFFQVFYAAV